MVNIEVSVGLPPTRESAEIIAWAEQLGYSRAYLFDTPFEGEDVWYQLHRAAEATSSIGLSPGVLVPSLRHPIVNAAQTLSLHMIAPGRVATAFGTGFSSRDALGQPPIKWSYMQDYISAYQALLAGEVAEWEGQPIKLLVPSDLGKFLPAQIPLAMSALGPRGHTVSKQLGAEGLLSMFDVIPQQQDYQRRIVAVMGTVLEPGEELNSPRVRESAGTIWAVQFHLAYVTRGADAVRAMPGGDVWLDIIERVPERERHLAIHQGHLLEWTEADRAAWDSGGYVSLPEVTLTGTAEHVGARVRGFADKGATEVMLQPSGPHLERELQAFIDAVRSA
ncbi:LLM class flavin-dependent oxidoreductase [Mycobacteroides abscessus]|uniref:LLM class flavin-dependent oxidoreductase n=1 Tax=Mycobacteroides abscessus TaxID=36809 RepID=UPI000928CB53|nr:LLM class flavin-dependent oxidoreductase [Mycobacteroides abscessus]SHQ39326.1 5,10-methylene tetrahydro methanopterin reductase [Mycobacteroides abscessus subsp. abscessus]